MSERYRFIFDFEVRADAPSALHAALESCAVGITPSDESLCEFPGMVQAYLRPGGYPGDGVHSYQYLGPHKKYRGAELVEVPFEPHQGSHHLLLIRTFHDDEYGNGGLYFPYWLLQFAARQGPVAIMTNSSASALPQIISKHGDRLIETNLAYHPSNLWPSPHQAEPDSSSPVIVEKNQWIALSQLIKDLEPLKDGFF